PLIMDEWDKTISYEGLSIVTYQGGSYTSKKRVPVGIDINDNEYWSMTGNYNAQVENYRQEVRDMQDEVDSKVDQVEFDDSLNSVNQQWAETKILINDTMSTQHIQSLLDNGSDFKFLAGNYLLEGREIGGNWVYLNIPSNVNIEMEQGTVINIVPSDYGNAYNRATIIFRIVDKENIVIDGGVLIGDRENTTDRTGEWGYGIKVDNSSNITIKNMQLNKTWGDGIAVQEQSKDVFIHNIVCDNNRRQGMTIGHVENLYVSESSFINTQGTPPAAGVDLEPSGVGYIRNIVFDKCVMRGNSGSGFEVNLVRML